MEGMNERKECKAGKKEGMKEVEGRNGRNKWKEAMKEGRNGMK